MTGLRSYVGGVPAQAAPSPNHNARSASPNMVVLHYTGMQTAAGAVGRLRSPRRKVSCHYLIDEDGGLFALVPEDRRAWHAGVSQWGAESDINGASIGVELVHPGHDWGYRAFSAAQMGVLQAVLTEITARWDISPARVVGHSDIAPGRKIDPGERFPWRALAAAGLSIWPQAADISARADHILCRFNESAPEVATIRAALARHGYAVFPSDRLDATFAPVLTAFRQRFRGVRPGPPSRLALVQADLEIAQELADRWPV